MPKAIDVAHYFQSTIGSDPESDLTPFKLQRLCAYTQGIHLAWYKKPMFSDTIAAWNVGPIIPYLYQVYSKYGRRPVPTYDRDKIDDSTLCTSQIGICKLVGVHYGRLSPAVLREYAFVDFPGEWGTQKPIPMDQIMERFGSVIKGIQ